MPLVSIHKARRSIKKRPEWQDTRPPEKELRAAYDIAARHDARWTRAYTALTRELLTPKVLKRMRTALQNKNTSAAIKAIPGLKDPAWTTLGEKFKRVYVDVMTEAGENEFKREGIPLTFRVEKAKAVPVVPVNPWSLKWIESESGDLIKEVRRDVQLTVRQIINRGYKEGLRSDSMLEQIQDRVGLLAREENAVQNRLMLMLDKGIPFKDAEAAAKRYAAQLLKKRAQRIARTETVTAQSKGRRHAWAEAKNKGELPDVEREWAAVIASPRTCEICEELDGKRAKLGEDYYSSVLGREVEGPGADSHPQCRCVELLRRGGK